MSHFTASHSLSLFIYSEIQGVKSNIKTDILHYILHNIFSLSSNPAFLNTFAAGSLHRAK